jgi:signal transduction histidine kinase
MLVLNTPRRITLYWLLLLLPAVAVGAGAILLLRREQAWLAQRNSMVVEARREAVAGRARLAVENIELLLGDLQNGLFEALGSEGGPATDAFLEQLEKTNPLVQTAFRATPDGRIVRPAAQASDEKQRAFLKRFADQFGTRPPWAVAPLAQGAGQTEVKKREQDLAAHESPVRQDLSKNVERTQSARREVQELFKTQNIMNSAPVALAEVTGGKVALADTASYDTRGTEQRRAPEARASASSAGAGGNARADSPAPAAAVKAAPAPAVANAVQPKEAAPDRRGWLPTIVEQRLLLLAWVQRGGAGEVRGVEINSDALLQRLMETLPTMMTPEEGYGLRHRDHPGPIQTGIRVLDVRPSVSVPLSPTLLPGWIVEGYFKPAWKPEYRSPSFFWLSTLLVIILVLAIASGGGLLVWQARRSEEEAAQKTSFVANVSHEFKTPLTTIRLYSELLEQGRVRDREQAGEYLRTIGRETQRLARLVNNALDFSRLEQGKKKYACEEIELGAELGRLLETHAPRVCEAGLELRRDLPAAPVRVKTDRDALEQIVLNLIDNACKYAGPSTGSGQATGGEVSVVVVAHADGRAEVRVRDRGPGVPEEHRERIFEKFHRVDDKLTAEKTGAGLGLSIARQLARGLGGELRYEPREGGGAEFVLELP